ncbi:MAG: hypothetical protein RR348_06550 [Clostridia bacterium]
MEELVGQRVKVVFNATSGLVSCEGKILRFVGDFMVFDGIQGVVYYSTKYIRSISILYKEVVL